LVDLIIMLEYLERREQKIVEELKTYFEKTSKDSIKEKLAERAIQSLDKFDAFIEAVTKMITGMTFGRKENVKIEIDEE
jgi:hypothetical protein